MKFRIKKNDKVKVIAGNDNGKTGKVLKIYTKTSRVIIEGVNLRKRHTRPSQRNQQGGIIEKEMPIHISNVMLVDPKLNVPTRVGSQKVLDEKTKKKYVRISVKSGEMI